MVWGNKKSVNHAFALFLVSQALVNLCQRNKQADSRPSGVNGAWTYLLLTKKRCLPDFDFQSNMPTTFNIFLTPSVTCSHALRFVTCKGNKLFVKDVMKEKKISEYCLLFL
ncbi:hypothetical protein C3V43_00805 [Bacteroides heparinolyticus]|nr:hypothetical protein C3V43_00805 [Bacteroides heparinolyticus]